MARMIIKKATFSIELDREELIEVSETADGVVFNFKHGLQLTYSDQFMQTATKSIIKNSSDHFPGKKLIFDLDNVRQPVMVDAL
ncbi:MAG: hypothetical protein ACTSWJ_08695 [Candidatus Heimdallarchaeaceae archaeon]